MRFHFFEPYKDIEEHRRISEVLGLKIGFVSCVVLDILKNAI